MAKPGKVDRKIGSRRQVMPVALYHNRKRRLKRKNG